MWANNMKKVKKMLHTTEMVPQLEEMNFAEHKEKLPGMCIVQNKECQEKER